MAQAHQVDRTTYVDTDRGAEHGMSVAARIVSLVGYVILALLAFRFVLSLFGANRGNPFADFIYDVSHPLVAPFFGLFNYTPQVGISRFEFETLIAMLFYGIVIGIIVRALSVGRRDDVV